jgi:hypothetical protein
MKTPSNQLERQLTQTACEQVILHAAKVYTATLDPSIDYSGFSVVGVDQCLIQPDQVPASPQQRIQWQKYQWMNWAASPSDLTLHGCIQWAMLPLPSDGDDDFVTTEQVCAVLAGHRF